MFALTEPRPYVLERAPLVQALAQVRFPVQARLASLGGLAPIQEGLAERYPYLTPEQVATFQVQVGAGQPATAVSQTTQFVFRDDAGFSVTVTADTVSLAAGEAYDGADDFKQRFDEVLRVLNEALPLVRCDRVAARYLSVAAIPPGNQDDWTNWFRPEITGWVGSGVLPATTKIESALNQVQLGASPTGPFANFPGDVTGLIRNGLVPGGATIEGIPPVQVDVPSYVLDLDLFTAHHQAWRHEQLAEQFSSLHTQIDSFFRWALTDAGCEFFGLREGN